MNTSESIVKLAPALLEAKKAFRPALKTAENPHFRSKYVDLAGAIDSTEQALSDNGLIVVQGAMGSVEEKSVTVTSRLIHASGEWIETSLTLPAAAQNRYDAQTVGSAVSYGRRYTYMALLGIAAEDDDGSAASGTNSIKGPVVVRGNEIKPFKPAFANDDHYTPSAIKIPKDAGDAFEDPLFDENGDIIESKATIQHREQKQAVREAVAVPSTIPVKPGERRVTAPMARRFIAIAKNAGREWDEINAALKAIGVTKAEEIPSSQYKTFVDWAGGAQ